MNNSDSRYYAVMVGGAKIVEPDQTWKFTTRNSVAKAALIQRRTC
jgi:hypothetical protein